MVTCSVARNCCSEESSQSPPVLHLSSSGRTLASSRLPAAASSAFMASRIGCLAASEQSCTRSLPVSPCVRLAICHSGSALSGGSEVGELTLASSSALSGKSWLHSARNLSRVTRSTSLR